MAKYGIAVKTKDSAGGMQLNTGQDFVSVEGELWVLLGDPVMPHGLPPHDSPYMAEGCSWLKIDGVPVCREQHLASCGHPSTGRSWAFVVE